MAVTLCYNPTQDSARLESKDDPCPGTCPGCGQSDSIDWSSFDMEGDTIYQSGNCGRCGAEWRDEYDAARRIVVPSQ